MSLNLRVKSINNIIKDAKKQSLPKTLGWDEQKGMIGNVVNVPVDIKETISKVLPRNFNDTYTFQIYL